MTGFENMTVLAWLSTWHVILVLAIVLLLFGGAKLPELARGLAKGIRIFREELHGTAKDIEHAIENPPPPAQQPTQPAQQAQQTQVPPIDEKKA